MTLPIKQASAISTHPYKSGPDSALQGNCVVICHKQLGDMVLLEPALAKLSAAHGGSVALVTRSGHGPLISLMEGVKMIPRAWLKRFDRLFCYDHLDKSALHSMLTFARSKELLLRSSSEITGLQRRVFDEIRAPGLRDEYLAEYNFNFTIVDSPMRYRPPRLILPADAWKPAAFDARDYLLLNPTAGWKSKRWKTNSWTQVVETLFSHGVKRVIITSGGQDWQIEHSKRIADALGDRATYLGGQTTLPEFLWLVANARMVLGVDGSASHLASAFERRSLTLFFRTNPHHWHSETERAVALSATPSDETDSYDFKIDDVVEPAVRLWEAEEAPVR